MDLIDFYGLEYAYYDHPGKYSLILYSGGCNLRCYGCHNRKIAGWEYYEIENSKKSNNYCEGNNLISESDKVKQIFTTINTKINIDYRDYFDKLSNHELEMALDNPMLDMVILCGGEFLMNATDKIKSTIEHIKSINPNLLIRVDTNGTFPGKVAKLIDMNIVDGFAIDIKGPYWDQNYYQDIAKVIGVNESFVGMYCEKIVESLNLVKNLEHSIFRTVKYPIIEDENYFKQIQNYVDNNLKSTYQINDFVEIA